MSVDTPDLTPEDSPATTPGESPGTGAQESDPQALLQEIAAVYVGLGPESIEELAAISERIDEIAAEHELPIDLCRMLAAAAERIETVAAGEASDPGHALRQAGDDLDVALEMFELRSEQSPDVAGSTEVALASENKTDSAGSFAGVVLLPEDADAELLAGAQEEFYEHLDGAESSLLALESTPDDKELLNTIFRAFHTIKGASSFLGLEHIKCIAHLTESLFGRARNDEIQVTGMYADVSLRSCDLLRRMIEALTEVGPGQELVIPEGFLELYEQLRLLDERGGGDPSAMAAAVEPASALSVEEVVEEDADETIETEEGASAVAVAEAPTKRRTKGDTSVRVGPDRLDRLIDMVGELVIAHSIVAQDETVIDGRQHMLAKKVSHTGKIVRELQDLSMAMRMVPLKGTFQKMARLVRDLAVKSGKEVQFTGEGDDTEIDRNMVDLINDPLVHMIRNAVDHGIEPSADRVGAGKSGVGQVKLKAYHAGGNVIVELSDDGRGLSREKLAEKGVSKGLIESDKGMSDQDVFNLIFEAGFSTAAQVTDISGRGVGMDVVRRNIEALRGRVDINSIFGGGSTFSIRLPLTMAITDGMLIRVGTERFIVPTLNIKMSLRPEQEALSTIAKKGEMLMLMGELIPLYRLHRIFNIEGAVQNPVEGLVMVMDDGDRRFAILVDELLGKLQVVAKTLGEGVGHVPGISGGAILGDGRVGLILDPQGLSSVLRTGESLQPEAVGAGSN